MTAFPPQDDSRVAERPAIPCPICGRPAEPALFADAIELEEPVMRALIDLFPDWRPSAGACPNCVGQALDRLSASGLDLHAILSHHGARSDDPQVAAHGRPALPVPLRLHANPLFRGAGVVLALLDSGFYPHPDLTQPANRIRATIDAMADPAVEGADFSAPEPRSWHGLMTSAVAAGNGWLSGGRYRGIASEAELVLARVGRPNLRIPDSDIRRGVAWMLANHARLGIRVLNISLGGDEEAATETDPLDRLAEALVAEGVMVVAAAGNAGRRHILPPASAPSVLTVGGSTDQNVLHVQLETFEPWRSSFGPTMSGHQKPEVVAPSMLLAAPLLPGTRQAREAGRLADLLRLSDGALEERREDARRLLYLRTGGLARLRAADIRLLLAERMARHNWLSAAYQFVDGTSVAAPIVSSIAVQMVEANPSLTPATLKRILMETAVPMRDVAPEKQGRGVVSPAAAVAGALRAAGGPLAGYPRSPEQAPGGPVSFFYYNPRVRRVGLIGDFNGWFARGYDFTQERAGVFVLRVPAPAPGVYRYKFLLDDRTAVDDPESLDKEPDGYGRFNSRIIVRR
jgi:serine protease AprX